MIFAAVSIKQATVFRINQSSRIWLAERPQAALGWAFGKVFPAGAQRPPAI
ncbi:hypothetical protein [Mesorhizobium intechi]|uniref:hypothetical protein n=1 Tax=Mesorhizobium TaxID=68287 RepID=UPI00142F249F|nr:hypothetical protein [Mesorhizobium intechi]